jgi:putative hemolysin
MNTQIDSVIGNYPAEISAKRYTVRIAQTLKEIESALRLRYEVFSLELAGLEDSGKNCELEFDEFDYNCKHLIVIETRTRKTVGTYRLNTLETAGKTSGFYSSGEFSVENLPPKILAGAVEIGRACIAREHRNTKVLFLLWKGLAGFVKQTRKRYFFGCCSIFTQDCETGKNVFRQLKSDGFLHEKFRVEPRKEKICDSEDVSENSKAAELPMLFKMYLKIGAKVCGLPTIDREFGTIDFFVIFDVTTLTAKYRRMFFGEGFQTKILSLKSDLKSLSKVKTVEQRVP